jgi:hypothetical protein
VLVAGFSGRSQGTEVVVVSDGLVVGVVVVPGIVVVGPAVVVGPGATVVVVVSVGSG